MSHRTYLKNYSYLKAYLECSDGVETTTRILSEMLKGKFSSSRKEPFYMLDVGCSDGQFTFSIVSALTGFFPKFNLIGLEPEKPAFKKFKERAKCKGCITPKNQTIQEFVKKVNNSEIFDYIQFAQCWYHFPKEEWEFVFAQSYSLLKKKGLITIILDSCKGEVYKLKESVMGKGEDTLEFGRLHFAEDIEKFLDGLNLGYETNSFPVRLYVKDSETKLNEFARHLAFLYRTFPERILTEYKNEVKVLLEGCKKDKSYYLIENLVKVVTVGKP